MSSFRRPYTVLREAAGGYVNGVYAPGARTAVTVQLSAQPVVNGRGADTLPMPEGRHFSDAMKFYTSERLRIPADGEGIQADIIVFDGYGYELFLVEANQSGVISHYKYAGVKVFKFTNNAAWIAGTLKRP